MYRQLFRLTKSPAGIPSSAVLVMKDLCICIELTHIVNYVETKRSV